MRSRCASLPLVLSFELLLTLHLACREEMEVHPTSRQLTHFCASLFALFQRGDTLTSSSQSFKKATVALGSVHVDTSPPSYPHCCTLLSL